MPCKVAKRQIEVRKHLQVVAEMLSFLKLEGFILVLDIFMFHFWTIPI